MGTERTNQTWGVIYEDYYSHERVYVLVRAPSKHAAKVRAHNFDAQTQHPVKRVQLGPIPRRERRGTTFGGWVTT